MTAQQVWGTNTMASSFGFYSNTSLTLPVDTTKAETWHSNLDDNPKDFVMYFGSVNTLVKMQAASNPGTDNIVLSIASNLASWIADTVTSIGDSVQPTTPNGYRYQCTSLSGDAKTHAATEPTWPTTIGSTVVDDAVTWTCAAAARSTSEIKLALTSLGLDSATGGASLVLGTTINGGTSNKVTVYVRHTNAVTTVSTNAADPELVLQLNNLNEYAI